MQIIARELGVDPGSVVIVSGDTATTPHGGGAWASRGTALGGEAALNAAKKLRENILTIAAALLQSDATTLRIESSSIVNAAGMFQISLADIASMALYRAHLIPLEQIPSLEIVESCAVRKIPYIAANGIQGAHVEVDPDLGTIRVLDFWVVEDCGRVINPMLVDEQIRGGVIQGIGSALYEQCIYSENGQLENGSLCRLPGADGGRNARHQYRPRGNDQRRDKFECARRRRSRNSRGSSSHLDGGQRRDIAICRHSGIATVHA